MSWLPFQKIEYQEHPAINGQCSTVAAHVEHMRRTYALGCIIRLLKHVPLECCAGAYIGTPCVCVRPCMEFSVELCPRLANVAKNVAKQRKCVHFCSNGILCTRMYVLLTYLATISSVEILRDER